MRFWLLFVLFLVAVIVRADQQTNRAESIKTPANSNSRVDWDKLAKTYSRIVRIDPGLKQLTVVAEGETQERTIGWNFETEFYSRGMWGNASDFAPDQRVYVLATQSETNDWKLAHTVADEMSMQGFSRPYMLKQYDKENDKIVLVDETGGRTPLDLLFDSRSVFVSSSSEPIPVGQACFFNTRTSGDSRVLMELLDATSFASEQRRRLQLRLDAAATNGLTGRIVNVNQSSNRVTVLLRRSDSWIGRGLQAGEKARAQGASGEDSQKRGMMTGVRPEHSRLRVTFEVAADALPAFLPGAECKIFSKLPKTLDLFMPPDLGRFTARQDRIDYFLSTIYCTCGMTGTSCAGHWNTLASCQVHGCGVPNQMTQLIGEWIDAGMTDPQILDSLIKREGELVLRRHLETYK